jgi:hypothetical protein
MTGHAESATEAFDFKLGEWVDGIGLLVRHTGYGEPKETGAGIWPSVEKAKEIADQMVKSLLGPESVVSWIEISD